MHALRSLDIWDTLLRRRCHPEAVKLATAQHLLLRFPGHFADKQADHWRLYEMRLQIERCIAGEAEAAGHDGEYELTAVFRRWLETLQVPLPREQLHVIAGELAEAELAFELSCTFPDEEITDLLAQHPARRTVFLSDFYMSADMLARLLAHHRLDHIAPSGLVSCDVMRNKRSGRLFDHLHEAYGIAPRDHVHIGDNPWSDVETPRRLGIHAVHFLPSAGHLRRQESEALFASRDALFSHARRLAEDAADGPCARRSPDETAAFRMGVQAAPCSSASASSLPNAR